MKQDKQVLSDITFDAARAVVHADESLHPTNPTDPFWAETSWWAFSGPDGRLGGWFYLLTRRNLGVATLGIYVWDDRSANPWDFPYSKQFTHVPLAKDFDLVDGGLPDIGASLGVTEPFKSYWIRFADDPYVAIDVKFAGLVDPQPIGVGESTGHLDQLLWANGSVSIGGDTVTIDGPACRDRTWSTRPEANTGQYNCYAWGATREQGFHIMAMKAADGGDRFVAGFLWRDGRVSPVATVERTVVKRSGGGGPTLIRITLNDREGRSLEVESRPRSSAALEAFTGYLCWCSVMDWTTADGTVMRGEDHDTWPHVLWRSERLIGERLPSF